MLADFMLRSIIIYTLRFASRTKRPLHFTLNCRASSTMSSILCINNIISFMTADTRHIITRRIYVQQAMQCISAASRIYAALQCPLQHRFKWSSMGPYYMTTVSHRSDRVRLCFSSLLCSHIYSTQCILISMYVGVLSAFVCPMFVFNHILYDVALLISRFTSFV